MDAAGTLGARQSRDVHLLAALGTSVANVGLPAMAEAFGAPLRAVQWIVVAYLLAITTLIVGAGRLGDLVGRRRLLLVGIALFTVASLACALAPVLPVLIAARALQGTGAAVMMALTMAMVGDTVPAEQSATALGLLGTMSAVGTALGPSLGGLLLGGFGWRALFLLLVGVGAAALAMAHRHLPPDRPEPTRTVEKFDGLGTAVLGMTLGAYALALTAPNGRTVLHVVVWLALSAVGALVFVRVQSRTASPLLRVAALRDRALVAHLLANTLVATVMMATLIVGPFYLAQSLRLGAAQTGLTMSVGPLVAALAGVPAGRVADRFGARIATLVGLGTMVAGTLLLALPPVVAGVPGYVGPMALLTAGYALFQTANNAAVMSGAGATDRGAVAGLLNLSRNLGLVTGASVMGAIFAFGRSLAGDGAPPPVAAALGLRVVFAASSVLVVGALVAGAWFRTRRIVAAAVAMVLIALLGATSLFGQAPSRGRGDSVTAQITSPYPLSAAGWGPMTGNGRFMSRWAEDWSAQRNAGAAPALKAIPLVGASSVTMSGEIRLRHDEVSHAQLRRDNSYAQTLLRSTVGVELRLDSHVRFYSEVGTGQTDRLRRVAVANFQNDASLQQLFLDARGRAGTVLLGAMIGRQEFADGPRQLVSVSDGPNVHRTWNGARMYAHARQIRIGAFDLRATRQGPADFDETVDRGERLRGVNASAVLARTASRATLFLDPFWMRTASPRARIGERTVPAVRSTLGVRLWGQLGPVGIDWTLARQQGQAAGRHVEAWALFAVQSVTLADAAWKPRLDLRIDIASGGGARGTGTVREFDPLYASSAYVGEGQLLALRNLVMLAPSITVTPTARTRLGIEYGLARRYDAREAVQAGGGRMYPGTMNVGGHPIGGLLRVSATQSVREYVQLFLAFEELDAGHVLRRAGLPTGRYGHIGTTLRY